MREKDKVINIDYTSTKHFFEDRSLRYSDDNPYGTTMYQDGNKELVELRNKLELSKLLPLLQVDINSRVLDIACGVGRWADAIEEEIHSYTGVDFSEKLINIANDRNKKRNYEFLCGATSELKSICNISKEKKFNRVIIVGILLYLNDSEVKEVFDSISQLSMEQTLIVLREPIGIDYRLTLKDFYSQELNTEYNAIYRTREEILELINMSFIGKSYQVVQEGFLFNEENGLGNRKETTQYYWLIKV